MGNNHCKTSTADQQDGKAKKEKSKRKTQEKEAQIDRTKKECKRSDPSAASAETKQKPKRSRKQDTAAAPKQKSKKAKKEIEETAEVEPQRLEPPPKKIRKIQKYVTLYKENTATAADPDIKVDMKSNLKISELNECRLNIYWKTSACGCTSYSINKDIAYFKFGGHDPRWNFMTRMAMAMKCAEMFITWVHQVKWQHSIIILGCESKTLCICMWHVPILYVGCV